MSIHLPTRQAFFVSIVVILLFSVYQTWALFVSLPPLSTDQEILGAMILKLNDSSLFLRDDIFKNDDIFRFYTPSFLMLGRFGIQLMGDFNHGLLMYLLPLAVIFLTGMFLLFFHILPNAPLALIMALLSSIQRWTIGGTYWGIFNGNLIVPRTFFLAFAPWLFWLLWISFRDRGYWRLAGIGLAVGLLSNLHPVSGMHFMELMGLLLLVTRSWNLRLLFQLMLVAGGFVLGVLPYLSHFVENASIPSEQMQISFQALEEALRFRLGYLIFPFTPMAFLNIPLGGVEQRALIHVHLILNGIWLLVFLKQKYISGLKPSQSGRMYLMMILFQLPWVYWLLNFHSIVLLLAASVYPILIVSRKDLTLKEWLPVVLLTSIIFCTLELSYLLQEIWVRAQALSLTNLLVQQARMAKFVLLPLFLLVFMGIGEIKRLWQKPILNALPVLVLLVLSILSVYKDIFPRPWKALRAEVRLQQEQMQELFQWVREYTSKQSLFYTDELRMRFNAQRAITLSMKDLGFGLYGQNNMINLYEQFKKQEQSFLDPILMQSLAIDLKVDYILVQRNRELQLALPVVFSNARYLVYDTHEWQRPLVQPAILNP